MVLGARDEGAAILERLTRAKTIRVSELPSLLQEQPGRESATV